MCVVQILGKILTGIVYVYVLQNNMYSAGMGTVVYRSSYAKFANVQVSM